jgi:hypothetical protein
MGLKLMVSAIFYGYFAMACVTATIVFFASRWAGDERRPATHRVSLSFVAGLVWPMMLLGLVELSSVMVYVKAHAQEEAGIEVLV